jgi:Zn-finger protein
MRKGYKQVFFNYCELCQVRIEISRRETIRTQRGGYVFVCDKCMEVDRARKVKIEESW